MPQIAQHAKDTRGARVDKLVAAPKKHKRAVRKTLGDVTPQPSRSIEALRSRWHSRIAAVVCNQHRVCAGPAKRSREEACNIR